MTTLDEGYDVVVVGGRPAGAGLAGWLAQTAPELRVLMIDRAGFPSEPSVPSCPTLHPGTLRLLDELGLPEAQVAASGVKVEGFRLCFRSFFTALMTVPEIEGRTYVYSIERARFDHALWQHVAGLASVTGREGLAATGLVRDEASGRVVGVTVEDGEGRSSRVLARWVAFADGRFSTMARKVGAGVTEDGGPKTSSVFFADWQGVAPLGYETIAEVQVHSTGRGLDVLLFPHEHGRHTVVVHTRSDRARVHGDAQTFYLETLRGVPELWRRLEGARQVSKLLGVKPVGNGYRQAAGPGWFLVGDAAHYKDPVDGQGIYDALLGSRILARLIADAARGRVDEARLPALYVERLREATRPMFLATVKRVADALYTEPPDLVARTLIRWMLTDPAYQDRFVRFLCRAVPADRWLTKSLVAGAVARGIGRDLAGLAALAASRLRGERAGGASPYPGAPSDGPEARQASPLPSAAPEAG